MTKDYDAHSCRANVDEYGFCSICGAIVHGTTADYELHGYDPPEPSEQELRNRKYFTDIQTYRLRAVMEA